METMTLERLADAQEIKIGFVRPDGSHGSTPVWVVLADDQVFVRSELGPRGGWYRRLRANPDGDVTDQSQTYPVRAEPVADAATVQAVTRAYATKYAGNPYLPRLLSEQAASATLRLAPRD